MLRRASSTGGATTSHVLPTLVPSCSVIASSLRSTSNGKPRTRCVKRGSFRFAVPLLGSAGHKYEAEPRLFLLALGFVRLGDLIKKARYQTVPSPFGFGGICFGVASCDLRSLLLLRRSSRSAGDAVGVGGETPGLAQLTAATDVFANLRLFLEVVNRMRLVRFP